MVNAKVQDLKRLGNGRVRIVREAAPDETSMELAREVGRLNEST
jgi:hypothetical protein